MLDNALQEFLHSIQDNTPLAVAVSGGPDSIALMHALAKLVDADQKKSIHVLSVDHGLRERAQAEVANVIEQAKLLGLCAHSLKIVNPKSTSQKDLRDARYQSLALKMSELGLFHLITAHHQTDQAETVLMRLAHKSGLKGWGGMKNTQPMNFNGFHFSLHRPLLGVPSLVLRDYCTQHNLKIWQDPSNQNSDYERVRWRQNLPQFAKLGLGEGDLAVFGMRSQRADSALEFYVHDAASKFAKVSQLGQVEVEKEALKNLPDEINIRVLERLINFTGGATNSCDLSQLEHLFESLNEDNFPSSVTLGGAQITNKSNSNHLLIRREVGRMLHSPLAIEPHGKLLFDERFFIENRTNKNFQIVPLGLKTKKWAREFLPLENEPQLKARASTPAIMAGDRLLQTLNYVPEGPVVDISLRKNW